MHNVNKIYKSFIPIAVAVVGIICLAMQMPASAAESRPLMLKAKLDSTHLLMGNMSQMHLELVTDKGRKGEFPIFENPDARDGIITTCNGNVEFRYPTSIDTLDLGSNRLQITYHIPVQAFDSGMYQIPPIIYVSGKDTVESNSLPLKVIPLRGLTAESELAPLQGIVPPVATSWTDKIPDFIYYNWWWLLLSAIALAAIIVAIVFIVKKGGVKKMIKRPVKVLTPWDEAMLQLEHLKAQKLIETGREKEYYTVLTEILRRYLDNRFGINALEMTSQQILKTLADRGEVGQPRDYIRKILDMADFVKFAKMKPLVSEAYESMDYACRFVQETIPAPEPADTETDDTHEMSSKTKD